VPVFIPPGVQSPSVLYQVEPYKYTKSPLETPAAIVWFVKITFSPLNTFQDEPLKNFNNTILNILIIFLFIKVIVSLT